MPEVGDFILVDDLTDIESRVVVGEVLGLARQKYNLRKICDVVRMNELIGDIPIATKLVGRKRVGELVEAGLSSQSYTFTHFDLAAYGKDVVHVAISAEAGLKGTIVGNIMQRNTKDAAKEMAKMENDHIGDTLNDATITENAVIKVWTDGTADPSDDITAATTHISDLELGFEANLMAMHPRAHGVLVSNDNVINQLERGTVAVTGVLTRYCGLPILLDNAIRPKNSVYVMDVDAPAIVLGDGPELAVKYSGNAAFYNGWAIAKFREPKLVQKYAVKEITGVYA